MVPPSEPPAGPPTGPPAEKPDEKKKFSAEGSAPKGKTETTGGKLEDLSEEEIEKYLCERRKKKYAAEGSAGPDAKAPPAGEVEGGPAKKAAEGSIAGESQVAPTAKYSALEARLAELEGDRIASKEEARKAKLHQLRYHRAFDLDTEVERCRYAKMNDEQFGEHCQVIADNYIPTMANAPMPAPQELKMPEPAMRTKPERYTKEAAEQAIKICTELQGQGKTVSYETILENIVNGRPADWAGTTTT
jgi:hypothetical protein